jgi:transposase
MVGSFYDDKRERRIFTDEFKHQMVQLYASGKPRKDIIRKYSLTPSASDMWVKQSQTKDNLTPEEKELAKLRKDNKQLLMENDILKQAALILGRK